MLVNESVNSLREQEEKCAQLGGMVPAEENDEISTQLTQLLDYNEQVRFVGLRAFNYAQGGNLHSFWQNGKPDWIRGVTDCDRYAGVTWTSSKVVYYNASANAYIDGNSANKPTKFLCQFSGLNLAFGKPSLASNCTHQGYGSSKVSYNSKVKYN